MRVFLLLWVFVMSSVVPRPAVEFLQPRSRIILASITGTEIPVQIRVEPHADNRAYAITWCDGVSAKSMDGENEAAVQPIKPLNIRVQPGTCELVARVFGPGGVERARASLTLHICGGDVEECIPK